MWRYRENLAFPIRCIFLHGVGWDSYHTIFDVKRENKYDDKGHLFIFAFK